MADYKLDIKEVLANIDKKNYHYYSKLTVEEQKSIVPWTLMRFLSSGSSADLSSYYLQMTNELVNCNFSDLKNHPELQWMLMCIAGVGSKQFHPWIQPPKKMAKNKIQEYLYNLYPNLSSTELEMLESSLTKDELRTYLISTGMSDKEIDGLINGK
jgi:hypothetical protein